MRRIHWRVCLYLSAASLAMLACTSLWADDEKPEEPAAAKPAAAAPTPSIAATVNGEPIYAAEVNGMLAAVNNRREVQPEGVDKTKAEILRARSRSDWLSRRWRTTATTRPMRRGEVVQFRLPRAT